jgi:hypothetical protein
MSDVETRLRSLLARAHHSLIEGYEGGEWSWYVPDEVTMAAAKEQSQAIDVVSEIRRELGWEVSGDDAGRRAKVNTTDPTVTRDDLFSMLVGQVRYSLGRQSYVVGVACEQVRRYWRHLREGERQVIQRDVVEELARYERMGHTCGMAMDHAEWMRLVGWMGENMAT